MDFSSKKSILLILSTLFFTTYFYSQNNISETLDQKMATRQMTFVDVMEDANTYLRSSKYSVLIESNVLDKSTFFEVKKSAIQSIRENNLDLISMQVEVPGHGELVLGMYRHNAFAANVTVMGDVNNVEHYEQLTTAAKRMLFYRGVVLGEPNSLVTITMDDDEMMGVISIGAQTYNIGRIKGLATHAIYSSTDASLANDFLCGTPETELTIEKETYIEGLPTRTLQCVQLRVEVDAGLITSIGGASAALNYVAGLYNEVTMIYDNDNIGVVLSEVFLWENGNPYPGNTLDVILNQMNHNSASSDATTFLTTRSSGGYAWVGSLCSSSATNVCSVNGFYNNLPAYSWDLNVTTHELGHNLSSPHTHSCSWNGNNTAIDGCGPYAGYSEGCMGTNPSQGGTVMSYCHLTPVGMNLSLGFGPQPAQRIINFVNSRSCLGTNCATDVPTCTDGILNGDEVDVDCGGADCAACPSCDDGILNGDEQGIDCGGSFCAPCNCSGIPIKLTLNFDSYPNDISWQIVNSNNAIVQSGTNYGSNAPFSTLVIPMCQPTGCYSFVITDSFGDGLCCAFGDGSYELSNYEGIVYVAGAHFIDSETTAFCIGENPVSNNTVRLNLKAFLQGPFNAGVGMMSDDLRVSDNIPLTSPYAALGYGGQNEMTNNAVLNITSNNAIVDWVLVELRNAAIPSQVVASKVGLLQRDGDIVAANGGVFEIPVSGVSNVTVAVLHRNHFGMRSTSTFSTGSVISIDFTNPNTQIVGNEVQSVVGGKRLMIGGDSNGDGQVNTIDLNMFWREQNSGAYNYLNDGSDFNLDGAVNTIDKNGYWRINNSKSIELN